MFHLTIKIKDISEGKGKAFMATIPELNNSKICADTVPQILKLLPDTLKVAEKENIGIFKTNKKLKRKTLV